MDVFIDYDEGCLKVRVKETPKAKVFKTLKLTSVAKTCPSKYTENLSEENVTYLFTLRRMQNLFDKSRSPQQIQKHFASRGKFFPLNFVELVLGGEGGLARTPDFDSSTRVLEDADRPLHLDARTGAFAIKLPGQDIDLNYEDVLEKLNELELEKRSELEFPISGDADRPLHLDARTGAYAITLPGQDINLDYKDVLEKRSELEFPISEDADRPLHLDARTGAFAIILQGQDMDLDYEDVLEKLSELEFQISESFFWHFRFSRERFFTTLASQKYLWRCNPNS